MGSDECLSVCTHLIHLTTMFTECVLFARPFSNGLGYTHEENENPEILHPERMDMCLHM